MYYLNYKLKIGFIFCFWIFGAKSQNKYIRPITGTQTAYAISNIQKLMFSNGNLLVTPLSGNIGSHALTGVRYLNFIDLTLNTTNPATVKESYYVYPNPVKEVLHVFINTDALLISDVSIISLEERILLQQQNINSSETRIDVASLPRGIYLCRISNENTTQIVKFLKQ